MHYDEYFGNTSTPDYFSVSGQKSAIAYFNDLQDDLEELGLAHHDLTEVIDIRDMEHVLKETSRINNTENRGRWKQPSVVTELGAQILHWQELGTLLVFNSQPDSHYAVCAEAEPKLVASIDSANNPTFRSPILITDDHQPIAVAKSFGETTTYSFFDNPEYGLLQETFAAHPILNAQIRELPRCSTAYVLDIHKLKERFTPLRVATLAIPDTYRAYLSDHERIYGDACVPVDITSEELYTECDILLQNDPVRLTVSKDGRLTAESKLVTVIV